MKVAIIGTGAMGCLFGAKFSPNNDVLLMTYNQAIADSLNHNGLTVKEPDDSETHYTQHLQAYPSGRYDQSVDLVIILVKTPQTGDALKQNLKLIGPDTIVLTLQNGLGNYEEINKYVDAKQIVLGTTNHNSVLLGDGTIFHSGAGITTIGSLKVSSDKLQLIAELFHASGFECDVSDNIGYLLWRKLFVNLAINAFTYITLTPIGFISQNTHAQDVVKKIIFEAVTVAKADGHDFDAEEVFSFINNVSATHLMGYSSMSQDRKRGAKTEIDWINGSVVKLAKQYHIPAPYNELIVALVHAIEDGDDYNRTILK